MQTPWSWPRLQAGNRVPHGATVLPASLLESVAKPGTPRFKKTPSAIRTWIWGVEGLHNQDKQLQLAVQHWISIITTPRTIQGDKRTC